MPNLNRVVLAGHLGRDAEVKRTATGVCVANFSMATSRNWKDKNSGEWKKETDWHNIVFWRCEHIELSLVKGAAIYVEGKLQTRSYDKDGVKRYVTEVVADSVHILTATAKQADAPGGPEISDEDLPF